MPEHKENQKTIIFTDGSSRGNPGPGGWGAVVVDGRIINVKNHKIEADNDARIYELGGYDAMTTNNKMELKAAIEAISSISNDSDATLYTDSKYLINGITEWINNWKRNGWRTKDKKDVLNKELWTKLDEIVSTKNIKWRHIDGHMGIIGNERCDEIATGFADRKKVELYNGKFTGWKQ